MNKRFLTAGSAVLLFLFFGLWFGSCKRELKLDEKTVAIVGDYAIDFDSYKERYKDYLDVTYQKDNMFLRLGVLRNMINEILLKHYDDNSAIYNNPEFKKDLQWTREEMLLAYLKEDDIYSRIKVSEEETRKAYLRLNEKIAARHLYAPTEEEAYRLYDLLKKGASFDSLARQVFTDSTLKNNGGYLGYFTWGDMDPAFEDVAYNLKVGEISKPVKTAHGYSIIKVEDRKRVPIITETEFQKKKNQVVRLLKISRRKQAVKDYLKKVFNEDDLKFNEEGLNALFNQLKTKSQEETGTANQNPVVAEYKGKKWKLNALKAEIEKIPAYHLRKIDNTDALRMAIKGLFIKKELLKIAEKKNYQDLPEIKKAWANAQNNLYLKYKRQWVLQQATVPDSTLRHYYRKKIWKFKKPRELNVREILVGDLQLALRLKKRLLQGEDFASLAQKYSLRTWSAKRGGEIGFSDWNRFGNLKNKLWNAPPGKVIGPIEIAGIYGLFRVEGKKDAMPLPFEEVYQDVLNEYKGEYQTELFKAYLKNLRKKVKIERNLKLVKSFEL